jgi:hypothetical protein
MTAATASANKITVRVQLVEGGGDTFTANTHETVQALKHQAMAKLGVQPAPGQQYFLFLEGRRLSDGSSLQEASVVEGSVLVLATEPQVGEFQP